MAERNPLPHEEAKLLNVARDEALIAHADYAYLPNTPALAEAKNSRSDNPVFHVERVPHWTPLPDPPGAQSTPEGWLRAIDEALVVAHIGVANESDTYEQAKAKLVSLIGFHVDVATDPAVNGGWKLVPINPTKTFYQCFSAYDGTSYSNPFEYDDFVKDWREALVVAPEAKP